MEIFELVKKVEIPSSRGEYALREIEERNCSKKEMYGQPFRTDYFCPKYIIEKEKLSYDLQTPCVASPATQVGVYKWRWEGRTRENLQKIFDTDTDKFLTGGQIRHLLENKAFSLITNFDDEWTRIRRSDASSFCLNYFLMMNGKKEIVVKAQVCQKGFYERTWISNIFLSFYTLEAFKTREAYHLETIKQLGYGEKIGFIFPYLESD